MNRTATLKIAKAAPCLIVILSLALLVVLAGGGTAGADDVPHTTLPLGEKAPLFKATMIDGQPFDLQEVLTKKNTALFFWSLFCGPCREEIPLLQKVYQELQGQPVEFIGVNLDEPPLHNAVRNFLKTAGLSFPIVVNKSAQVDSQSDKLYLITGTPVIYLIRQDGTVAFANVGRMEAEDLKKAIQDTLLAPRK